MTALSESAWQGLSTRPGYRPPPGHAPPEGRAPCRRQSARNALCVSPVPTAPNVPVLTAACSACAALATGRRPGEYRASLNAVVAASRPIGKTVVAIPPENEVEM